MPFLVSSQSTLNNLDSTISYFFNALEESDENARLKTLKLLLKPGAQINAITVSEEASPAFASGGLENFHQNTKTFYTSFQFSYDEVERDVNYYSNLASINSLVYQKLKRQSDKQSYEQFLWFSIDLVYDYGRWWIVSASWINETESFSIRNVMAEDTLWHDLSQ